MKKHKTELFNPIFEITRGDMFTMYLLEIAAGIVIWLVSSPTFSFVVGQALTAMWGAGIALSATGATIGVLRERTEAIERWSGAVLVALLAGYAAAPIALVVSGDLDRLLYSILAVILLLFPAKRVLSLLRYTGAKKNDR